MSGPVRFILVFCILSGVAVSLWIDQQLDLRPQGNPATVEIKVVRGMRGRGLVRKLRESGLVSKPRIAYWTLRLGGTLDTLQAGTYQLPGDASMRELPGLLADPARRKHQVLTLIPGESVWEAAQRMEAAGLADQLQVLKLAADRAFVADTLGLPVGPERASRTDQVPPTYLEGFLYPETLYFTPGVETEEVLTRIVDGFKSVWKDLMTRRGSDWKAIRQRYDLKDHELVVLASLVQEESTRKEEAPHIAGVFYNRIERGMPLQTDPTLVYHPASVGRVPTPDDRRNAANPYNTYAHKGLPPGPICSPDRFALSAVLTPARHQDLYFVARQDGSGRHVFAKTLDEHRLNIRRYLKGEDVDAPEKQRDEDPAPGDPPTPTSPSP